MKQRSIEIGGWIGVALILLGYGLVSTGYISGNAATYHLFMLIGSLLVAMISLKQKSYQPAILNICFLVLAAIALVRLQL